MNVILILICTMLIFALALIIEHRWKDSPKIIAIAILVGFAIACVAEQKHQIEQFNSCISANGYWAQVDVFTFRCVKPKAPE